MLTESEQIPGAEAAVSLTVGLDVCRSHQPALIRCAGRHLWEHSAMLLRPRQQRVHQARLHSLTSTIAVM